MEFLELIPPSPSGAFIYGVEIEYGAQLRVTLIFDPVDSGGIEQLRGREIPRSLQQACLRLHDRLSGERIFPEGSGIRPKSLGRLSRIYLGWQGVYETESGEWFFGVPTPDDQEIPPATFFLPSGAIFALTPDKEYYTMLSREEALLRGVMAESDEAEALKRAEAAGKGPTTVDWPGPRPKLYAQGISLELEGSGVILGFFDPELYFRRSVLTAIENLAKTLAPLIQPICASKTRRFGAKGRGIIFISYRMGKEGFAERLAKSLKARGFQPWLDRWEIHPGDSIPQKISEAFEQSDAYVPVVTGDFPEGKWATKEMRTAVTKAIEEGYLVVPVLWSGGQLPQLLREIRAVDANSDGDFLTAQHLEELVVSLRRISRGVLS